jgi:hypothetical protein
MLSIGLLGPPEVSIEEGRPLRFGTKKSLALLCYLAAEGGRHSRRELAELLWPQSDERHARTDLRSALAKLRKTLGEDGAHADAQKEVVHFLLVDGALLGIESRGIELDLEALQAAVSLARTGTSPGGRIAEGVGRGELIGRSRWHLGIYRGEFMEGFSLEDAPEFELWLEGERTRWRICVRRAQLRPPLRGNTG